MRPIVHPRLIEPPREPDVAILGAGAAGIGAARRLLAAGLTVAILEARMRVGGRAITTALRGHPIDLGAHWLHAGPVNPLVKLGRERREPLRRAAPENHLVVGSRRGTRREREQLDRAFALADRALARGAREVADQSAAAALRALGPWGKRVATIHGLVSGRMLGEVSLRDFLHLDYEDNFFITSGFGAYVGRLAAGLPIRLGAAAHALDWSGNGVAVETEAGRIRARAAIVTVPVTVLQRGAIRFTPTLPEAIGDAIGVFLPGIYEHVVMHWPGAPFRGADRLASVVGPRLEPPGLLTRIDGSAFHYFELDHPTALRLDGRDGAAAGRFARAVMRDHFGNRSVHDLGVAAVTEWRHDPLARGSWAVVPPGSYAIRNVIQRPVGDRVWFAGEAGSRAQSGTVGGAWAEGERAADAVIGHLRRAAA